MSKITIITEKLDVAKSMASAMGWVRGKGGFEGKLNGDDVIVQWARGHLVTMESPDDIDPTLGWNNPLRLAPIPRAVKMQVVQEEDTGRETSQARFAQIKAALKDADEVILATDADREGEYIGWSILEHCGFKKKVRRCWLAEGMDEISMRKALSNLLPANAKKSLARAAEARARCDWAYMYLVRLLTFYGRHGVLGNHLGRGAGRESVVSAGRVQSAALYMIYKREMDIRNFIPRTFYNVFADFGVTGISLEAEYAPRVTREMTETVIPGVSWEPQGLEGENKIDKPLFIGKKEVDAFSARLKSQAANAKVVDYKEGTREKHPPITFDLVAAKAELSKRCKINGDSAQAVIEDLYEQGYISYPRTAHGELPNNLYEPAERDVRLNCVIGVPGLGDAAQLALDIHTGKHPTYKKFKPKVFVSKKLEHHGLIPSNKTVTPRVLATMTARKRINNKLSHTDEHMRVAYILIAERFVQALLPPVVLATQRIVFEVPAEDLLGNDRSLFIAKAERTIDAGWEGIMTTKTEKASELPKLKNGTPASLDGVKLKEGETKTPSRYSEANFEKALQQAAREVDDPELRKYLADGSNKPEGIGTPATRKDIIPTIKARGYIKADSKGVFFLEPKGQEYIEFQDKNGKHWMYKIETTAEWEGRLSDLAELEDDEKAIDYRDGFVEDTLSNIDEYINWMNSKYSKVDLKPLPRTPSAVTDRMKSAIKSIAERKNIKLPSGVLSNPEKASAFLQEHTPQRPEGTEGSSAPSAAQLSFLAKVEAAAGVKASDEVKADRKMLSDFIDTHKAKLDAQYKAAPPTEKMISFAKDLAAKLPKEEQPGNEVYERMDACKAFLDAQSKKKDAKGRSK